MKIIGIIPARYNSSRFPGKPLADICDKPMIWWVYHNMLGLRNVDELYVATDDERIADTCKHYSIPFVMTSSSHETGSDRLVEVADKISADLYVVVLGDEPLIVSEDVNMLIDEAIKTDYDAYMLVKKFENPVDVVNSTTIKMALNDDNEVIFMSRATIPYPKGKLDYDFYKHVGAYVYRRRGVEGYREHKKSRIERIEDLEMLRLIEKHYLIKAIETNNFSISVDTKKDLERVNKIIREKYQ